MTQIDVTFLGTTASVPTPKRGHPAIHVRYQSENEHCFLWDCGEGTQRQIFSSGLNFMRLNNLFITHWHADHFGGLLGLMQTMSLERRTESLRVFGPEAGKFVPDLISIGYAVRGYKIIPVDVPYDGSDVTVLIDDPEYQIVSIPVKHGIPAVAFGFFEKDRVKIDKHKAKALGLPDKGPIFKKLKENGYAVFKGKTVRLKDISFTERGKHVVYSGDTKICDNLIKLAENCDLLIHDCTYFEDMERKHSSLSDILKIYQHAKPKQIALTHISRRYQSESELQEELEELKNPELISRIRIARDFMSIKL